MEKTIIISAGGTGGHIFPALAVAKELQDKYKIIWVGAKSGLENTLVPNHGFQLETVSVAGVRGKGYLRKLKLPITLLKSAIECLKIIIKYKPVAIVGFGGYATFPICMVGGVLGKPIIIHEQNSIAGLTNKLSSKFARVVLTAFPNVLVSSKTHTVGNPVRNEIIAAYNKDKFTNRIDDKLSILIIGGSLGAKALNDNVPLALSKISGKISHVTHQVGRGDIDIVKKLYHNANITNINVVNFITDMAAAYLEHDLIICRAGASTVSEVAATGSVAIFVPFPHAVDDHQTYNAKYLSDNGGAILLPQTNLTADSLAQIISTFSVSKCAEISAQAYKNAVTDSTSRICKYITSVI